MILKKEQNKIKRGNQWLITITRKKVFILGGSIVNSVQGCMKYYVKPSIRENNPDHIMFHVGINDLPPERNPQVIAQAKVDLGKSVTDDNVR